MRKNSAPTDARKAAAIWTDKGTGHGRRRQKTITIAVQDVCTMLKGDQLTGLTSTDFQTSPSDADVLEATPCLRGGERRAQLIASAWPRDAECHQGRGIDGV